MLKGEGLRREGKGIRVANGTACFQASTGEILMIGAWTVGVA